MPLSQHLNDFSDKFFNFLVLSSGSRSNKTFRPKKTIPEGTHQYDLMKHAAATLGSGNLRLAVMLPEGEDLNEWIAVNIVDFFNQINMLYGTITEFCTEERCPVMSAGPKYEYHWADGQTVKKPIKCSAPKYIDYLMTWVQDQLDDESLFPSKIGKQFNTNNDNILTPIQIITIPLCNQLENIIITFNHNYYFF